MYKLTLLLCSCLSLFCQSLDYKVIDELNDLEIKTKSFEAIKTKKILLKNGIKILVINDSNAKNSACSVCVGKGSWQDPDAYPGMAHFVEHLLFMGSKKYPKENAFDQYILDNSGSFNAYTASDKTVYMFSSTNEAFSGALDIFGQFFIDPLFSESGIKRELNAVDQEHNKNLEHEGWREYMVLKELSSKKHPFHKFSTGTAKTLEVIPRNDLIDWYQSNYSPKDICIVLYSNQPLESMQSEAIALFSQIPERASKKQSWPTIFEEEQKGKLVYIEPLIDEKKLSFIFELSHEISVDNSTHTDGFLAYVLKNTGEGSITSNLKKEQLIYSMDVSSSRFSKNSKLFCIEMELTKRGVAKHNYIIQSFFDALKSLELQSISPYIFNEYKNLKNIYYTYQSRQSAIDYVTSLAAKMPYEEFSTFPKMQSSITRYKPLMIKTCLKELHQKNCVVILKSPRSQVSFTPTLKERYIGARYCIEALNSKPSNLLPKIQGPRENPFVPSEFKLHSSDKSSLENPRKIISTPFITAYFAQDKVFCSPKVSLQALIHSEVITNSARNKVLLDLFIQAAELKSDSIQTSAAQAGLSTSFAVKNNALAINFYGFYQHMPLFVETILKELKNTSIDKASFDNIIDSLKTQYQEQEASLSIIKAQERFITNQNKTPTTKTLLKTIDTVTIQEFQSFCSKIFNKTQIQCLISGSVEEKLALNLCNSIKSICQNKVLAEYEKDQILFNPIKKEAGPYIIEMNSDTLGHATFLSIQDSQPFTSQNRAHMLVLEKIIRESFFTELRSRQQTGYIVGSKGFEKDKHQFLCLFVHSTSHQPQDLLSRFDLFIEEQLRSFDSAITKERFCHIKSQIITLLKKPHDSLSGQSAEVFSMIFEHEDTQRKQRLIDALEKISFENFKTFTFDLLSKDNRARLAVLCKGKELKEGSYRYTHIPN